MNNSKSTRRQSKQSGYMNLDLGGLIIGLIIAVALVAAPLGWLLIECAIWLFQNVQIGLK